MTIYRTVFEPITVAVYDSGEGHGQDEHSSDAVLAASVVVTDVDYDCGTGNAVSDAQNQPGLATDCEALLEARINLAGSDSLNWSLDTPITAWDGVHVGGTPARVTRLDLKNREFSGIIPSDVGFLTGLQVLDLSDNRLTGSIPPSLDTLRLAGIAPFTKRIQRLHSIRTAGCDSP